MAFTWRGYQFREQTPHSPTEAIKSDGAVVKRNLWIPWEERSDFITDMLGYTVQSTAADGSRYFQRILPFRYEEYPGPSYLYARSVDVEPDRAPKGFNSNRPDRVAKFQWAKATVEFGDLPYNVVDDDTMKTVQETEGWSVVNRPDESTLYRYVSWKFVPRGKFQTIPGFGAYRINDIAGNPPVSQNTALLLVEGEIILKWHQIPIDSVPRTAILTALGKTNDSTRIGVVAGPFQQFVSYLGFGRLICMQPDIREPYRQPDGSWATDITYKFAWHPQGANRIAFVPALPDTPGFYNFSRDGASDQNLTTGIVTGDPLMMAFPPVNMRGLFRPEP